MSAVTEVRKPPRQHRWGPISLRNAQQRVHDHGHHLTMLRRDLKKAVTEGIPEVIQRTVTSLHTEYRHNIRLKKQARQKLVQWTEKLTRHFPKPPHQHPTLTQVTDTGLVDVCLEPHRRCAMQQEGGHLFTKEGKPIPVSASIKAIREYWEPLWNPPQGDLSTPRQEMRQVKTGLLKLDLTSPTLTPVSSA